MSFTFRNAAAKAAPAGEQLVLASNLLADTKTVGGEITTRDQSQARARISGVLVVLSVREGDMVSRGQQIGRVVDDRIGFETRAYGAQVAAAEAEATRARADLGRIQDLYDHNVYAKARLDQAVAASRAADAQTAAARAERGASASMAGQGAILAPAAGRVFGRLNLFGLDQPDILEDFYDIIIIGRHGTHAIRLSVYRTLKLETGNWRRIRIFIS